MTPLLRRRGFLLSAAIGLAASTAHADLVESWGYNYRGELGNGTTTNSSSPVMVAGMSSGVTAAAAGDEFSLSVQGGGVFAWGFNASGELGTGNFANSTTPLATSNVSTGVTAIAAGTDHGLALQNGGVFAWGDDNYGQLGNGSTGYSVTPVAVQGMSTGVTAIAAGEDFSLALRNGSVYDWGYNREGQLGNGTNTSSSSPVIVSGLPAGVTTIAAGSGHGLAIANGGVYSWGANYYGELGIGTTTTTGYQGIASAGAVSSLTSGVTAIAGGVAYSLAVKNGGVYAWGENGSGQLGDGTTTNRSTPEQVDPVDLTNIVSVSAGFSSSYALSVDGSLWVWGDNQYGELGLGSSSSDYLVPQHLLPPSGYVFTSVSGNPGGGYHTVATLAPVASSISVPAGQTYHFTAGTNSGILTQTLSTLTVNSGGEAIVDVASKSANRQLLVISGALTLAGSTGNWTGLLDLGNNDLDLGSDPLATIINQVCEGYSNGKWNGSEGIISASGAIDSKHLLALGVILNNQSGTALFTASHQFDGTTPSALDILVKSTYYGDANLDGVVDGSDYTLIDNGYLNHLTSWYNGDFNYDSIVDGSDYTLIDNAFNTQGAGLASQVAASTAQIAGAAAVPEPSSMGLVMAVVSLCRRRR